MMEFMYNTYMLPFWIFKYIFPIVIWITVGGLIGFYIEQWWRHR